MIAAIIVGIIAGWLAGKLVDGVGFGLIGDLILGLIGGLIGGAIFGSPSGMIGAIVVATIGAAHDGEKPTGEGRQVQINRAPRLLTARARGIVGGRLIPSFCILETNVVRFIPRRPAAPF